MQLLRGPIQNGLRLWSRIGKAPGLLYRAVEWFGRTAAPAPRLPRRLPNGLLMSCDLRDAVQRQIYFFGCYEPVEAFLFCRLLRSGMTVIDAGANVGQYTLLASTHVGQAGRVHAFEPVPQNFERLSAHVRENGLTNADLNCVALWSHAARVSMGSDADVSVNAGTFGVNHGTQSALQADAVALDDYLEGRRIDRVDLIKMDIEGSEPAGLLGMQRTLRTNRPTVIMEINRTACERAGTSTRAIWDEMVGRLNYHVWLIGLGADRCRPLDGFEQIEQSNVIFHQKALPPDVSRGWTLKDALRWARILHVDVMRYGERTRAHAAGERD